MYGHLPSCAVHTGPRNSPVPPCTCGFTDFLAQEVVEEARLRDEMAREIQEEQVAAAVAMLEGLGYTVSRPSS